jgi:hypothetical protein
MIIWYTKGDRRNHMKAIIYHSASKKRRSEKTAKEFDGDLYEIKPLKPIKNIILQMIVYGFKTVAKRSVSYEPIDIDFSKYDEIVLVSPVWASRANAFMRQFLNDHPFKNKKVQIIGNCDGGYNGYFQSFESLLDDSNKIIKETMYVKGVLDTM